MKDDFNKSYKRTRKYKIDVNTHDYKLKRYYFAKFILQKLNQKKKLVFYDETWFDKFNYIRYEWTDRGEPARGLEKPACPRITVVAAVDSDGNKYASITQSNSTRYTTQVYLFQLITLLEKEDNDFRDKTILVFDGATHHLTADVRALLQLMNVQYCVTSPFSPQLCPVETYNAFMK